MNPFESGERKVVPAVLVYVRSGDRVLMVHRNGSPDDYHSGKWNGLGGKLEPDESPLQAARRELLEESGLDLTLEKFRALGVLQFPNFKAHKSEDWVVFVFSAAVAAPAPAVISGREGELHWVDIARIPELPLWAGDREFIPLVLQRKPFLGTIWYKGERVERVWIQEMSSAIANGDGH